MIFAYKVSSSSVYYYFTPSATEGFLSAAFCLSSVRSFANACRVPNPQLPGGLASQSLWNPVAGSKDSDIA